MADLVIPPKARGTTTVAVAMAIHFGQEMSPRPNFSAMATELLLAAGMHEMERKKSNW